MNKSRLGLTAIALLSAGALVLTGCSADGGGGGKDGNASAIITTNGSEPQHPLIPTNTNEVGGGKILDAIFSGLFYYDFEGKPQKELAESVETEDSQLYTIKIKSGQKFTNDEPVTADSFIDAWNYGATLSNKHLNAYFFEDIEGYSDEVDAELTGLTKVSDTEFTVMLKEPLSDFPLRLGYSAYYPLPAAAFADMEAYGENPAGNGPYMLDGEGAWKHDERIDLVKNPDYTGGRTVKNDGLSIIFYASQDAAYADLLGDNLDVLDALPDAAFVKYKDDLPDRWVNQPAAVFQSFTIPESLPHFSGEEGKLRRQALSMSIDREEITDVIFKATRTPASDFTSPVIPGWTDELKGSEVLEFDKNKAKELWAKADAIAPWDGSFQIAYNADGGHQSWVDAVTNSIKNTLGIEASGNPYPTFAEVRTLITKREITTAFRTGWQADYPGTFNFLGPIYATNASSNDGDYSNPAFDRLIAAGAAATDVEEGTKKFVEAQEILLQDLPVIPLWYSNVTGGFSKTVDNVVFGWNSVPLYYDITRI